MAQTVSGHHRHKVLDRSLRGFFFVVFFYLNLSNNLIFILTSFLNLKICCFSLIFMTVNEGSFAFRLLFCSDKTITFLKFLDQHHAT